MQEQKLAQLNYLHQRPQFAVRTIALRFSVAQTALNQIAGFPIGLLIYSREPVASCTCPRERLMRPGALRRAVGELLQADRLFEY